MLYMGGFRKRLPTNCAPTKYKAALSKLHN